MSKSTRSVVLVGTLVALLIAGVLSFYASSQPDGLNRVAADKGFAKAEKEHALDDSPLAGYSVKGIDNERISGGLAGVAGVALTFALGGAVVLMIRRRSGQT